MLLPHSLHSGNEYYLHFTRVQTTLAKAKAPTRARSTTAAATKNAHAPTTGDPRNAAIALLVMPTTELRAAQVCVCVCVCVCACALMSVYCCIERVRLGKWFVRVSVSATLTQYLS